MHASTATKFTQQNMRNALRRPWNIAKYDKVSKIHKDKAYEQLEDNLMDTSNELSLSVSTSLAYESI